jgi:hypothetical protein
MNSTYRGCQKLINISFGEGKLNVNFDPRKSEWSIDEKAKDD